MESRIGFGGVALGFATDAPRGSAGSVTDKQQPVETSIVSKNVARL